jgi:hypothetical protein
MFYVSGTTAADKSGNIIWMGNPYLQSIQIIKKIQTALQKVDASLKKCCQNKDIYN